MKKRNLIGLSLLIFKEDVRYVVRFKKVRLSKRNGNFYAKDVH